MIMANYSNITKVQRFFYNLHASKVAFIGAGVSHAELIRLFLQYRQLFLHFLELSLFILFKIFMLI